MEVPEWNIDTEKTVVCPLPQRPPQINGFYYDPKKEELHIYWQPLDVWEYCSKDMWYTVSSSNGHIASVVGRDYAVFSNWLPELPANLTIQSENSLGSSLNSSHLRVPILTNAHRRQPRNVWYDDNIKSIRWDDPIEKDNLEGYTLYSCRMSTTNSSKCDDQEPMLSDNLEIYRTRFQFGKSQAMYHMAIVANYNDGSRGGMVWSTPAPSEGVTHLVVIVGSSMLIFLALYALCFKIYRKIRYMMDFKVELPYFQPMKTIQPIRHDNSFTLEGNISPQIIGTVLIQDGYLVKNPAQPEAQAPSPDPSVVTKSDTLVVGYTIMN
ncbi:hypothetical protein KR200_010185 [Drosophila serrata]|nr:hypothetical protein KR200_010185 [Drosophila serrata]